MARQEYEKDHGNNSAIPKSGYWSTAYARIRGLGLGTVSMHIVSPWNRPLVTLLLIWLVTGYFPCALSYHLSIFKLSDSSSLVGLVF